MDFWILYKKGGLWVIFSDQDSELQAMNCPQLQLGDKDYVGDTRALAQSISQSWAKARRNL